MRGFEALTDRSEIYSFEDGWKRIQALTVKADTVIFVLSPDAISSDTCRQEVAFAASLNKRFAPIVCRPVDVAKVPIELSRLNFITFEDQSRFEKDADQLENALSTNIEWIRKHTEFGELSRRWEEAGKPRGLLLRSPALEEERALKGGYEFSGCKKGCPTMVVVPSGSFLMGSQNKDGSESDDNQGPQHTVTIGKSFGLAT